MPPLARLLFLALCAALLSSCSDYPDTDSKPKMKQHARTDAMGNTTYTYTPVDAQ